jgi:putative ABC transport system permease protein
LFGSNASAVQRVSMNLVLALRRLRQQPGFVAGVVATLALALGATTAIFSVANAVLLRPLPYPEADGLVMIEGHYLKLGMENLGASAPELADYAATRSFEGISAFRNLDLNLSLTDAGEPERVSAAQISASLFPLLRVAPQLGRNLRPEEQEPGADAVVLLSDGVWRRRFGANPAVVGTTVHLDGRRYGVLGVMPPGFEFPHPSFRFGRRADLWIPLTLTPEQRVDRSTYNLRAIARLGPGVSLPTAQAEMRTVARRLEDQHPRDYRGPHGEDGGFRVTVAPFKDEVVGDAGRRLGILLGAVALLFLIASANVASLFLARGLVRRRDFALRLALGATRSHLARESLAECLVLSLLGGALGLLLAFWGSKVLVVVGPASVPRLAEVGLDGRVLAFALLLSLVTGIAFSLVAPLSAGRIPARESLAAGAPSGAGRGRSRLVLVVAQQALALVLLVDAGLLVRSLHHLQTVDSGFVAEGRLALEIALPGSRYPEERQQAAFFQRLLTRVAALPGVGQAGLVTRLPLTGEGFGGPFSIEGRPFDPGGPPPSVIYRAASPGYLETMGIPLRRGRRLAAEDAPPAPPSAVVNETMVRLFFAREEVLGRRLKLGAPGSSRPWLTVVGVVGDASDRGPGSHPRPAIYVPYSHQPASAMTLVVRAPGDPRFLAGPLRAAVRAEDPEQAVAALRTLDEVRAESVAPHASATVLLAAFAFFALLLAAVGVYGVAAHEAGRRTLELGIRLALGAGRRELLLLLASQSLVLALAGTGLGLAGAFASTRVLGSLLVGVAPTDPLTLIASALGLTTIAVFAASWPAWKAARLDPVWALRRE